MARTAAHRRAVEAEVRRVASQLAAASRGAESRIFHLSKVSEWTLRWAMRHPDFRTELFRFVDVYPATRGPEDVFAHLDEHLSAAASPPLVRAGMALARRNAALRRLVARIAGANVERMGRQFILATGADEAAAAVGTLWEAGAAATVDLLGEKTVTGGEADAYVTRVGELLGALSRVAPRWPERPVLETDDLGRLPRVNISVKPTALSPHLAPLSRRRGLDEAHDRLRPVLAAARDAGAHIHFDAEHYDVKDLTLELFRRIASDDELEGLHLGVVIQAYLRDSRADLAELIAFAAGREPPVTVRLVKGAYWDTEMIQARAAGWPEPVQDTKDRTDASFERCVRILHDHHGEVRAAFGTHNLRSMAYAIADARLRGIPDDGYEIQMLHGMAEPLQVAIRSCGFRLRLYTPVGELVPGMAYLVRRLLENTSNESFVRLRFAEGRSLRQLLRPPSAVPADPPADVRRPPTDPSRPAPYRPEPVREWRRPGPRAAMAAAVGRRARAAPVEVPVVIGGVHGGGHGGRLVSTDPADPDRPVAVAEAADAADAGRAVDAAVEALPAWAAAGWRDRAAVLFRAAAWLRDHRDEIAAFEVFEAGKPWAEADADVCEAIDFCEYYGRQALAMGPGVALQSPPGERNRMTWRPRGVAVVIAPWNFPLAIPTGMTVAALVTGNTVVLKPAEQTPGTAYWLVRALEAAGLPAGVLGFCPGDGETVGGALVADPRVATILFTGSAEVGLAINRAAAVVAPGQRHVKRVIAEMGGKNAIVVDADADPDQAVPAIIRSAFGFSGQKCSAASRLVVTDPVADAVISRVVAAAAELEVGPPREPGTDMGPLIDEEAAKRVSRWVAGAPEVGRVLLARDDVPSSGWYVGPTVVEISDPDVPLACQEIFGPVLAVLRARDLDEALRLANHPPQALTGGIFTRRPSSVVTAARRLRAGNIYVNRHITGAVVGRQPFGGFGLSGVGSKAGGPDYLRQLVDPVTVTENTVRQGFAPLEEVP